MNCFHSANRIILLNNTNKSSSLTDLTIRMIKTSHSLEITFLLITIDVYRLVSTKNYRRFLTPPDSLP